MSTLGFKHFVGIDGSEGMLSLARNCGLYQELKESMLGEEPIPVQSGKSVTELQTRLLIRRCHAFVVEMFSLARIFLAGHFDVVVIAGALSVGQVPVEVVRKLCNCAKSGGYICMTTRSNSDNAKYKAALDHELEQMEREGLWTCVEASEVEEWERAVSEKEHGYICGAVYLYQKL